MKCGIVILLVVSATSANAQGVTGRVTGAVGGVTAGVGATAGGATSGAPDFSVLNTTPGSANAGGDWNGGTHARIGGKDVTIRGAVASEGGNGAFKAGAGIGF